MQNLFEKIVIASGGKPVSVSSSGLICFRVRTPAMRLLKVFWQAEPWVMAATIDDPVDRPPSTGIIEHFRDFILDRWDRNLANEGLKIIPGYSKVFPESPDIALLLPPGHHNVFEVHAPELHKITVFCRPAYHCEFSGRESRAEYDNCIRSSLPPLADWSRRPWPRILVASHEWRERQKYKRTFANCRADALVEPIVNMLESEELEVRNYCDESVSIRRLGSTYIVRSENEKFAFLGPDFLQLLEYLTGWLLDNVWKIDHQFHGWRRKLFGV